MQAAIWPATAPELVAAVSEASGLGSIGSVFDSAESVQRQIARVGEITPRPFAVNYVVPLLDEAAFRATLEAQPAAVSFALGDPGELVERAHNAGAKVVHQIHTVGQARKATLRGGRQVLPSRQARHSAGWRRGDADERHIRADHRRQVLATVGGPAPDRASPQQPGPELRHLGAAGHRSDPKFEATQDLSDVPYARWAEML
jgi:hypothetical protein